MSKVNKVIVVPSAAYVEQVKELGTTFITELKRFSDHIIIGYTCCFVEQAGAEAAALVGINGFAKDECDYWNAAAYLYRYWLAERLGCAVYGSVDDDGVDTTAQQFMWGLVDKTRQEQREEWLSEFIEWLQDNFDCFKEA
jgi:hypothetical protein